MAQLLSGLLRLYQTESGSVSRREPAETGPAAKHWNAESVPRMLPKAKRSCLRKRNDPACVTSRSRWSQEKRSMSNPPIIRRLCLSTANRHMLTLVMSLTVVFSMPAIVSAQGPPVGETFTTRVDLALKDLEEGLGSSQRQNLFQVQKFLGEGKLEQAEPLVDKVLEFFEKETTDTRVDYVSVANRATRALPEGALGRTQACLARLVLRLGPAQERMDRLVAKALEGSRKLAEQGGRGTAVRGRVVHRARLRVYAIAPLRRGVEVLRKGDRAGANRPDGERV